MSKSRSGSSNKESESPPLGLSPRDSEVKTEDTYVTRTPDVKEEAAPIVEESMTPPLAPDVKPVRKGPQLIGDLPRAEEEALRTFIELPSNHYQYGTLGRSREALESMTCDCQYEHGVDSRSDACGHDSDCINRLTQVECLPDDCRCRSFCQNQRFQRRQYAPIEVVQTEKKGFGIRAADDIHKDDMIYEYIGDVISQPSFIKRMREYAEEGIRHFYFMMLQKDEYIDATKRGGIGRFLNHSCAPNCYVAKWTVGNHYRMGIFASRNVQKDEELTFNYNVDRYGHDAQPCYCGEPKCVGFIGGKTQTDIGAMDDLYLDALGITDEVERLGLKGSKKKKSKKLDEDYMPDLKPIVEKDIPKVVQAMRQTQSRKVLYKLLTRVKITEDQAALRQLMRLRGFSLMTNILDDYAKELDVISLALECMLTWPLLHKNKVEDSKVSVPVTLYSQSENEVVKALAQKLLDHWDTLETAYRIPKRVKMEGDSEDPNATALAYEADGEEMRPAKRSRYTELLAMETTLELKPLGRSAAGPSTPVFKSELTPTKELPKFPPVRQPSRHEIAAIIAAASAAAASRPPPPPLPPPPPEGNGTSRKKSSKPPKKPQTKEEKEANKEKRLQKLVGSVVVKCMSKYQKQLDHAQFKKHAKELTQIIADKEKKSSSYKESKLDTLSDEKVAKIKKFAKEYIAKILHKMEKSGKKRNGSSTSTAPTHAASSVSAETPDSHGDADGGDVVMAEMTVEEAMDLGEDSASDEDGEDEHQEPDQSPDPSSPAREAVHDDLKDEAMEAWARHPEESVNSWDRDRGPTGTVLSVES